MAKVKQACRQFCVASALITSSEVEDCAFSHEGQSAGTPIVIKAVAPVYPSCGLAANTFGLVRIDVRVNAEGVVTSAVFVGADEKVIPGAIPHAGLECLRKAAEAAARRWVFASRTDHSQETVIRLGFRFVIINEEKPTEDLSPVFLPPYDVEVRGLVPPIVDRNTQGAI